MHPADRCAALFQGRLAGQGVEEGQVFRAGEGGIEADDFWDIADCRTRGNRIDCHILSQHQSVTAARSEEPQEQIDRGCLAGAIGPQKTDDFSSVHHQIKLIESKRISEALGQTPGLEDGRRDGRQRHDQALSVLI